MTVVELTWQAISSNPTVALTLSICTALGTLAGAVRLINALRDWKISKKVQVLAKKMELDTGVSSFTAEDIAKAQTNYIEPSCTQTDPSDEDDLSHVVALANLFDTIDAHFVTGGEKRHVIVLADSGMGKTSFCINYYARELNKKQSKRRSVAVIPLGRGDAVLQIKAVPNKRESICFLDAFDEDPEAIGNQHGRLVELMSAASDFRNIVVTCRSQFFANDDDIPKGSGIMYAAPRKAGMGREFPLHKIFLAPLSAKKVDRYLKKHFPLRSLSNWKQRSSARALVAAIPELSARPMLLELLPDLVRENKTIEQLFGLYNFLVEKWLQREKDWISESDLLNISIELAVVLFIKQRRGQGDRISGPALEELADAYHQPLDGWKLKSRSLLNRDIQGYFKFAHRSVLEYLVVVAAIGGDERCLTVEWTDLMKDLLVSRGNMPEGSGSEAVATLLARDLTSTGLLPLASPLKMPHRRAIEDCKQALHNEGFSHRHARRIPLHWRNIQLTAQRISSGGSAHAYEIVDPTHGLRWHINDTSAVHESERHIFRDTYATATLGITATYQNSIPMRIDRSNRLPSLEELMTLLESEPFMTSEFHIESLLDAREIYWLGDTTDSGCMCVSFGPEPRQDSYLKIISTKATHTNKPLHLYELQGRHGIINRVPFTAMAAYVSETGSEEQFQADLLSQPRVTNASSP